MYLLLTLHFCSSPCGPGLLGGRYDQGEIRKCLYHIPPPLASPCLYLPAVYIAPLDAGHLDKQDWITKKVVSVLLKSGQRLQVTPCKGRSQGNDHPDQYSPRMWSRWSECPHRGSGRSLLVLRPFFSISFMTYKNWMVVQAVLPNINFMKRATEYYLLTWHK